MVGVAAAGYGLAGLLLVALGLLLLSAWRSHGRTRVLLIAVWAGAGWALLLALQAWSSSVSTVWVWALEALRSGLWVAVLFSLLLPLTARSGGYRRLMHVLLGVCSALVLVLLASLAADTMLAPPDWWPTHGRLLGHLLLAVIGLILVEQVFRNIPLEQRWALKYLCFALGGMFAYDFYLYTDALLFNRIDPAIWAARGGVNALMLPLLALSVARFPTLQGELFVSRRVVFHTTALLSAGVYMLVMALTGYYIQIWGGEWGSALQIVFLFGAAMLLVAMLFSGQLRSRAKVFFNKHFFNYRYDYREEWLRLIGTLSGQQSSMPLQERVIWALAEIVESPAGLLWEPDGRHYRRVAAFGCEPHGEPLVVADDPLIDFMRDRGWVVNMAELTASPERYDHLTIPDWLLAEPSAWLLVPLMHDESLQGFVLLFLPRSPQSLNYENLDLLKTAGMQAASYLALNRAAEALAEARQFEGFNRLSAFVIHDLKNLIAQLSLVARNAERHRDNPAFMDDAVKTIENAVGKMNRLMGQLKGAESLSPGDQAIDLVPLLGELVASRAAARPAPQLMLAAERAVVKADQDRLTAVIGHVVQNAQDATPPDGSVVVELRLGGNQAIVDVRDTGSGMDAPFIEHRLFRPFDSTKGLTGMGIGAYECREFVRAMGGQVVVDSHPGKGTCFSIRLPLQGAGAET